MPRYDHLDNLTVEKPCPKDWDKMDGDDATRFCAHCQKNVHNLSAMSKPEASRLLNGDQPVCVRFTRDKQGKPAFRLAGFTAIWAGILALTGCGTEPERTTGKVAMPAESQPTPQKPVMGDVAGPAKPVTTQKPQATVGELVGKPAMGSPPVQVKK